MKWYSHLFKSFPQFVEIHTGKDPTEAEKIKKRWQKCTEELCKKGLNELNNHDSVVIHLEPDILECEVNWVLASITMNKVKKMEFQLSYFKSLKMML